MIKINLPEFNVKQFPKIYIGNRQRYATATAVSFVNEKLILAASFFNKKIYLIKIIDDNNFDIIDSIDTRHFPDLMDYKDGLIVTSDYPYMELNGHASFYSLVENKVVFKEEIVLEKIKAHGSRIVDDKIVITSNSDHNRGCLFIDLKTREINNFNNFEFYPKDIFFTKDRILIVTSKSLPNVGSPYEIYNSILYLFDKNTLEKVDELHFEGQTDSLTLTGEHGFITIQGDDSLVYFKLKNDKLTYIKKIFGFDFPHGIASFDDNIAVTNYGDNSVRVFKLSELIY